MLKNTAEIKELLKARAQVFYIHKNGVDWLCAPSVNLRVFLEDTDSVALAGSPDVLKGLHRVLSNSRLTNAGERLTLPCSRSGYNSPKLLDTIKADYIELARVYTWEQFEELVLQHTTTKSLLVDIGGYLK